MMIHLALERMGFNGQDSIGFSAHGFRATASTMPNETRCGPATTKGEYMEARRAMLQQWADLTDEMAKSANKVTPIKRAAT